jgi:hypothetical protein
MAFLTEPVATMGTLEIGTGFNGFYLASAGENIIFLLRSPVDLMTLVPTDLILMARGCGFSAFAASKGKKGRKSIYKLKRWRVGCESYACRFWQLQ